MGEGQGQSQRASFCWRCLTHHPTPHTVPFSVLRRPPAGVVWHPILRSTSPTCWGCLTHTPFSVLRRPPSHPFCPVALRARFARTYAGQAGQQLQQRPRVQQGSGQATAPMQQQRPGPSPAASPARPGLAPLRPGTPTQAAAAARPAPAAAAQQEVAGPSDFYSELEAAAARFKHNHELMEDLFLPSPNGTTAQRCTQTDRFVATDDFPARRHTLGHSDHFAMRTPQAVKRLQPEVAASLIDRLQQRRVRPLSVPGHPSPTPARPQPGPTNPIPARGRSTFTRCCGACCGGWGAVPHRGRHCASARGACQQDGAPRKRERDLSKKHFPAVQPECLRAGPFCANARARPRPSPGLTILPVHPSWTCRRSPRRKPTWSSSSM